MEPWGTPASLGSPRKGAILGSFRGPLGGKPRNGGSLGYRHRLPGADLLRVVSAVPSLTSKERSPISSTIGPARFHSIYEKFHTVYASTLFMPRTSSHYGRRWRPYSRSAAGYAGSEERAARTHVGTS